MDKDINCCVVDDHCDIVPFLHACWKAKKFPLDGLTLIHVDSHPDLVPPPASVETFSDTDQLYDILEGVGGIAEFILPLVYNGHFDNGISWLHPIWSTQLPDGSGRFHIGDVNGRCCVSFAEPYFLDEGVVYDASELRNSREVSITPCLDSSCTIYAHSEITPSQSASPRRWVLDICLDYFSVCNPFIIELEAELARTNCGQWQDDASSLVCVITDMFHSVCFRKRPSECNCRSLSQRRLECSKFNELLGDLLDRKYNCVGTSSRAERNGARNALEGVVLDDCCCIDVTTGERGVIAKSYACEGDCEMHWKYEALKEEFLSLFVCHCAVAADSSDTRISSNVVCNPSHGADLVAANKFLDALSTLPSSVRYSIKSSGVTAIATLPHHLSTQDEINLSMNRLEAFLSRCTSEFNCAPDAICIARSDGDGFTSADIVDSLQEQLILRIERLCTQEWNRSRLVLHDIRNDCFVKCRELFIDSVMSSRKRKLLEESGFLFSF